MKRLIVVVLLLINLVNACFSQSQDVRAKRLIVDQSLYLRHWIDSIMNDTTNLGPKTLLTAKAISDLLNGRLANIESGGAGGGFQALGDGFGLVKPNDSTYNVDSLVFTTKADRHHLKDSLASLLGILKPVRITNANFASATEYDDPEFAAGQKISVFVNQLNRFLDSASEYIQTVDGIEFTLPGFDAINNTYDILIWKVRDGVAGIGLPVNLSLPYNIEQAIDYRIRRRPDGTFHTTYDWAAIKNSITGSEIWVNPVTGNDANAGTEGSPKKSISWVLQFGTANIIHLAPGWYNYEEAFNGVDINRDIRFEVDGIAYITTSDTVGAWSEVVGNPGAYEATYSGPSAIEAPIACDFSNKDVNGVPIRLNPVTSIALVASTPNSVYAVPGTNKFYVHTFDDRAPDDSIKVFFEKNGVEMFAPYTVYFENMRFMGEGSTLPGLWFDNNTGSGRMNIVFKNCWIVYGKNDGVGTHRGVNAFYKDCIFAYNGQDGSDIDRTAIVLEEDCIGYYNGYSGSNADNGSTAHGNSIAVRVNGVHKYNAGRNVHDIEEATSYNVNIVADSSRGGAGTDYAFATSSPNSLNTTMYFIDCISEEPKGWDIRTVNGHAFYFNSNQESVTNNVVGDTITLSGYQFDPYPIVVSAEVTSATAITIEFSEPVTATTAGWSFKVNGVSQNPSAVSGSGTNTLVFTVTTITSSDVVTRSYSMSTGNTQDSAGNELVNFTDNRVSIGI